MKNCPKCNVFIKEDSVYCSNCGVKVEDFPYSVDDKPSKVDFDSPNYSLATLNAKEFANLGHPPHGYVLKLLAFYEILFGLSLIFYGISDLMISDLHSVTNQFQLTILIGLISIVWGISGPVAGVLIFLKKQQAFNFTKFFIYTSGLFFTWPLIFPFIVMIVTFIYFNFYDSDELIFETSSTVFQ